MRTEEERGERTTSVLRHLQRCIGVCLHPSYRYMISSGIFDDRSNSVLECN